VFQLPIRIGAMILFAACSVSIFADDATKEQPGIAFRLAEPERADGLTEAVVPNDGPTVFLHSENVLTDRDVTSVTFGRDENGRVDVTLQIEAAAAKRLAAATKAHLGKRIAILLDGRVITAPIIRSEISDQARITGRFSNAELIRMFSALVLHSSNPEQIK
jgi:preprotein translocase subunit SecD